MPRRMTTIESHNGQYRATCTCGYKGMLTNRRAAHADKDWHKRTKH